MSIFSEKMTRCMTKEEIDWVKKTKPENVPTDKRWDYDTLKRHIESCLACKDRFDRVE